MTKRDNIKVKGYKGTWYIIDEAFIQAKKVYLLESEVWGEDVPALVVDKNLNVLLDECYNGFDDYIYMIEE